ncbi:MAG: DUF86 domain-containing protein [Oscillospiraceae bacterium]|nr:DUF86 domain-containing protein [Oscillospiraceae bacterium]
MKNKSSTTQKVKGRIFTFDSAFRDSVSMDLLQIGELSGRLSEGFREQYKSEIPWKEVRGMRNLFAHNYIKMNLTIIWKTATVSVPILKQFCESILSEHK